MRVLKLFYLILGLWLSFTGIATAKPVSIFKKASAERLINPTSSVSRIIPLKHTSFSFFKYKKNQKLKSFRKVEMKKKATQLETTAQPNIYKSEFILLRQYHDTRNYGLTVLYHIARHTHLHLYQLF